MITIINLLTKKIKLILTYYYLLGFASVIMRQTNIIWVGMALGITVIDKFVSQTLPFIKGHEKTDNRIENFHTFTVSKIFVSANDELIVYSIIFHQIFRIL